MSDHHIFRIWNTTINQRVFSDKNMIYFLDAIGDIVSIDKEINPDRPIGYKVDWFTSFTDVDDTPIYQNDLFEFTHPYRTKADGSRENLTCVVTWDTKKGAWILQGEGVFRVYLYAHAKKGKVIGRKV